MKSKDKAKELVEKYKSYVYCYMGSGMLTNDYNESVATMNAKQCAIIAVEEIINTDMLIDEFTYLETPSYRQYWFDVIEEIKKL